MDSNKKTARIAGLLYLVVVLSGVFGLMYVPSALIVWNDAPATVNNIMTSKTLFRFGIVSDLISYTFFLFVALVLYKLLKPVNKTMAALMVILALVSIPISFSNVLSKFDILTILSGADYFKFMKPEQIQAEVMLSLISYNNGSIINIFWGLWLFPFGYLVFKSGILPKILGIILMAGCIGYIIDFLGYILLSNYGETGISAFVGLPASIGEIGICLWLLIMGAKEIQTN